MKRAFAYNPDDPRREGVLAFLCDTIRVWGGKVAITVSDPTRTLEQNARMWAMLHDIAQQKMWWVNGKLTHLGAEDWKSIFTSALKRDQRIAQGIDGGLVALGHSTKRMTVREMTDLMTLMESFGAEHNIVFTEPEDFHNGK